MKSVLYLTILLIGLTAVWPASASEHDEIKADLEKTLQSFAEKHSIKSGDVRQMLVLFLMNTPPATVNGGEVTNEEQIKVDIKQMLGSFAEQHTIPLAKVWKVMGEMTYGHRCPLKGGMGIIHQDAYILPGRKHNALKLAAEQTWEGKNATEQQVVFISESKVLENLDSASLKGVDLSKVTIVMFSPNEVRFIDLMTSYGCTFKRD